MTVRRFVSPYLLAAVALAAPTLLLAQSRVVTVHDAWVREPMGAATTAAAFAVVENAGAAARALVAVSADVSDAVELHEMKMDGDMMRMSPVKRIDVPAHGKVELKPGSFHVMIFQLKRKLVAGDKVQLTFTFDDGTKVPVEAAVRKPEAQR